MSGLSILLSIWLRNRLQTISFSVCRQYWTSPHVLENSEVSHSTCRVLRTHGRSSLFLDPILSTLPEEPFFRLLHFGAHDWVCMNRIRFLLSCARAACCEDSVESTLNNRILTTAPQAPLWPSLFQTGALTRNQKSVWREKTWLTSPEVRDCDSGTASFSPPHSRSQKKALLAWYQLPY